MEENIIKREWNKNWLALVVMAFGFAGTWVILNYRVGVLESKDIQNVQVKTQEDQEDRAFRELVIDSLATLKTKVSNTDENVKDIKSALRERGVVTQDATQAVVRPTYTDKPKPNKPSNPPKNDPNTPEDEGYIELFRGVVEQVIDPILNSEEI